MVVSNLGIKIAKNTIYQLFGKVISMLITVTIVLIVTRNYGREGYGWFSLMQTWPALFFVIVDFGINAIATRELTNDWEKASKYIGNILSIRIVFSLVLMLVLAVSLIFFPYSIWLKSGILLSLLLILTQALYATTNIIFQVKLRYDLSVLGYLSGYVLILVLALLLSYLKADVRLVSFTYVVGGLVTFLMNIMFMKRLGVAFSLRYDREITRYLLVSSLPLGLMFVFSQINFKADSILLSVMKLPVKFSLNNVESVAVYSLPYKVFEVALVVPTFFMNSVFPVMVAKLNKGKDDLALLLRRAVVVLFASGLAVSILGFILAPFAVNILGGQEFSQSILVLRILLAGLVLYYLTQPFAWLLVALGEQRKLPLVYLVSALFNLSANLFFIPKYSFLASSVITHASEFLILIMLLFLSVTAWKAKYAQN